MKKAITFRLRAGLDDDLAEAIKNLDPKELSEKARNGLRLMLGITTAPVTTVVSRSIVHAIPQSQPQVQTEQSPQASHPTPSNPMNSAPSKPIQPSNGVRASIGSPYKPKS